MIVYGSSMSPFVRKVLAFGIEKGVELDLVPAGMGRGGPAFEECSPFGKMPGFLDPGADDGRDFCIRTPPPSLLISMRSSRSPT